MSVHLLTKIKVNLPHLLRFVVLEAENGEYRRFGETSKTPMFSILSRKDDKTQQMR